MRDYIEIKKDLIPYSFNILLADEWFELHVDYNKTGKIFTVSLYKNGEYICTEPLILNVPLFTDIYQPGNFPSITIVPYGPNEHEITYDNFGKTVFLTIDNEGDVVDE